MMTMGFHRLPRPLLMLLFILTSSLSLAESADTAPVTYHSTVSEVRLTFFTTDQRNRSVDQLQKTDFAVVDNGLIVREFRSFTRSDVTQLDVLLLVDCSESVLSQFRQEIADVLRLVVQTQSISQDHISVVSFSGIEPRIICARNCHDLPVAKQLSVATAGGQTPLFDAVRFAADFLVENRDPSARPVLILYSDGEDNISKSSAGDAIEAVLASEAQVYAVDLGNSATSNGTGVLQNMVAATGGRYFAIHEGVAKALSAALEDLHAGYIVTYRLPSRETGFHQVRILPTHDLNLQFRCRRGYHYTGTVR
jgi:VWFA-related protein